MRRLKDKVALVMGSGREIDSAMAALFAEEGARVMMGSNLAGETEETGRVIRRKGDNVLSSQVDPTKDSEVKEIIKKTIEVYGHLDVLCNITGAESTFSVIDVSRKEWHRILAANLESVFLSSKYVLPAMIEQGKGVIINTSSIFGLIGWPNAAALCASQGGVIALTKQMAVDYGSHNIRVNCICHGPLLTSSVSRFLLKKSDAERSEETIAQMHPLGRFVQSEEIARVALFLASDEASFITGVVLPVDGGYTAK